MANYSWNDITYDNVRKAIERFKTENPSYPEPKSYYLIFEGKKLPAKHIRGMAYEEAFGEPIGKNEYNGGVQTQQFFDRLGFIVERYDAKQEQPRQYDSWTIFSKTLAVKKCDKSFFDYKGSGVPAGIRWFFDAEGLKEGTRIDILLLYEGREYRGYISQSRAGESSVTRMFWAKDIAGLFAKYIPGDGEEYPEVEFEKIDKNTYSVTMPAPRGAQITSVETPTNIDYIGVLNYLNDNQEIPYSNPEVDGIDPVEKSRLLAVKEKGQKAAGELRKMAEECEKAYGLDKCLPISWLDGSNTKTRRYLWAQMKYNDYADDPSSISIFVEKNGDKGARYRISLELKNDGTDKKTVSRYHSYLDMPIDFSTGLVLASGSNEWGHPEVIHEAQEVVKEKVAAGKYRKVQLCKYIERKPDETNAYFHAELLKAVGLLLPYYEHILGIAPVVWWPSKEEYDPGITISQWITILQNPEITTEKNLRMFAMMLDHGKPAACSELADKYGETKNFFNAGSSAYAKRVVEKTGCSAPPFRDDENARWWPVLYVGRNATKDEVGSYIWKMREELKEALEQIELPGIEVSTQMRKGNKIGLNTILYGPPGTGKTYHSAIYAVAICDGKSIDELTDYDAVMERYNELKAQKRVAFTTFHQSYGYEEFIEGIKPVVNSEKSDVGYTIESGVFKRFCENARIVHEDDIEYTGTVWNYRNRAGDKDVNPYFEEALITDGVIKIEDINDEMRQCNFLTDMVAGDWVVLGRKYSINAIGVVVDDEPEEITDGVFHYQRRVDWKISGLDVDCRAINRGKGLPNFAIAKSSMKIQDLQKIINGDTKNEQPYVFIIDEINRGNISKIFGELITLIENTKREGMPEAAGAILPYSGEPFSVPSNVYILGTMNTADRSIALMDTALRRRFDFEEMMPDPSIIEGITINADGETLDVSGMLRAINTRIEYLYDREHTIGHAFFTRLRNDNSMSALADIFKNNVVPLLQEYFYEDYEKIQLVLGDNDKSSDAYKFILDKKVNENDIFKKSPQLDLHEKTYEIQEDAFSRIRSYIEITESRRTEE